MHSKISFIRRETKKPRGLSIIILDETVQPYQMEVQVHQAIRPKVHQIQDQNNSKERISRQAHPGEHRGMTNAQIHLGRVGKTVLEETWMLALKLVFP